ncbi:hypothetical protein [Pseudoalteromonas aurantia]|uniref:hypothetical protein n=1 Tax=Pseudoalteromonas aurantia TaxID=43654 RepID=UPI001486822B|nr:hypothetical protein [Pseudoalteromonas aurantia]
MMLDSDRAMTFLPAHVIDVVIYSYVFDGAVILQHIVVLAKMAVMAKISFQTQLHV